MTWERDFDAAFKQLKGEFKHRTKRNFLEDVRAELEESERLQRLLSKRRQSRYVAVTFDRRQNDQGFSYGYFDLLLVALDALSGGSGSTSRRTSFASYNGTIRAAVSGRCFATSHEWTRGYASGGCLFSRTPSPSWAFGVTIASIGGKGGRFAGSRPA